MNQLKAGKRISLLFYLLAGYIFLQFFWWAYLLAKLNRELYQFSDPEIGKLKMRMIVGEGIVFFIFLLIGLYISRRTLKKEIRLVRQQHNFLLSITHELKTPLAAIKLSTDTLSKHENLNDDERKMLHNHVKENTLRLSTLIDNILLATRLENKTDIDILIKVNFSELTHSILSKIEGSQKYAQIVRKVEPNISGYISENSFESILTNMVENAIKYGEAPIGVALLRKSKKVVLKISDTGPGIQDELKTRVFHKFYRSGDEETRSKKGTGLGLYIVKNLVLRCGGNISIEDNIPAGSIFIVELPLNSKGEPSPDLQQT